MAVMVAPVAVVPMTMVPATMMPTVVVPMTVMPAHLYRLHLIDFILRHDGGFNVRRCCHCRGLGRDRRNRSSLRACAD